MTDAKTLEPTQIHRPSDNIAVPMDTEVVSSPLSRLEKLKAEQAAKINIDEELASGRDFNITEAIELICETDKYTKTSVFASWMGTLNMACIREAMKLVPYGGFDKSVEGRDVYDNIKRKAMQEYEEEGDFAPRALPSLLALRDRLRCVMYDENLEVRPLEDSLEFMCRDLPTLETYGPEYDRLVAQGKRPAMTRREFCEIRLRSEERRHDTMTEHGMDAVQLCEDLHVNGDRGFGDLPEYMVIRLYEKTVDKLIARRDNLNIRAMTVTKEIDQLEAEASQQIVEFVYKEITGKGMKSEY